MFKHRRWFADCNAWAIPTFVGKDLWYIVWIFPTEGARCRCCVACSPGTREAFARQTQTVRLLPYTDTMCRENQLECTGHTIRKSAP